MRGPIVYSDDLHPFSSHRTPGEIAEDLSGPMSGLPYRTLIDAHARPLEESLERTVASGAGRFTLLRARTPTSTLDRAIPAVAGGKHVTR